MIERPADRRQEEHDRGADDVDDEDRVFELALGHPAGQDRVRRVERPDVVVGVDAAGRVEVVVDHVVGGVGQDQPDDREQEQAPVDRRRRRDRGRLDGQQPADEPGPDGHREDRGAGDDQPLADRVERAASRAGWRSRGSPSSARSRSRRGSGAGSRGRGRRCCRSGSSSGAKTCVMNVARSCSTGDAGAKMRRMTERPADPHRALRARVDDARRSCARSRARDLGRRRGRRSARRSR